MALIFYPFYRDRWIWPRIRARRVPSAVEGLKMEKSLYVRSRMGSGHSNYGGVDWQTRDFFCVVILLD